MASEDSIARFPGVQAWTRALNLIVGAIGRAWMSVAAIAFVFLLVGCGAAVLLPRTYSADTRLLTTRNSVMPALANPRRAVPSGADVPLKATIESILSRHSLERLVRDKDLLARWDRERPPVLRLKDRVVERFKGPISEDDKIETMVDLLQMRVTVTADNDVVTVKAVWTERRTALDIVNGVLQAFLDARRQVDVQTIADTRTMLERSAAAARAQIDLRRTAVASADPGVRPRPSLPPAPARAAVPAVSSVPAAAVRPAREDGLGDLRSRLLQVRASRAEIEKSQQDKVAELEARLAEQRASQTDQHPDVVALRRALSRVREVPAELKALQDNQTRLLAEYVMRGGDPGQLAVADVNVEAVRESGAPMRSEVVSAAPAAVSSTRQTAAEEDEAVAYERSLLKSSLESYQDIVARIGDVQIELETAETAFGYRYSVVTPARLPKRASAPNVPMIVIGALLTGVLAGMTRAVFNELRAQSLLSFAALSRHLNPPSPVAQLS